MKTKRDNRFVILVIAICLAPVFFSAIPLKPVAPASSRTVTIELNVAAVLRSLAIEKESPLLNKAILQTLERQKTVDKDFVTLFGETFTQLNPKAPLAPVFNSFELREHVSLTSTNAEVLKALGSEMNKSINQTLKILQTRVESTGIKNGGFQKLPLGNRYRITFQNVPDPERLNKLLQATAQVGFWETYKLPEIFPLLADANKKLQTPKPVAAASKKPNLFDLLILSIDTDHKPINRATIGYASVKDTSAINNMLKKGKSSFPRDLAFAWTIKPGRGNPLIYELVAIKISTRDGLAPFGGEVIVDAKDTIGKNGQVIIEMMMNPEGARILKRFTYENIDNEIAIMIDGFVYAYPKVLDQISGGRMSITGDFTAAEAHDLATMIKAGRLPVGVKIVSEVEVTP